MPKISKSRHNFVDFHDLVECFVDGGKFQVEVNIVFAFFLEFQLQDCKILSTVSLFSVLSVFERTYR